MAAHGQSRSSHLSIFKAFLLELSDRGNQVVNLLGLLPFLHEYVKTNYFTFIFVCVLTALVFFKRIPFFARFIQISPKPIDNKNNKSDRIFLFLQSVIYKEN